MQAVLGAAGAFPLWLAPVQARILPVTDAVAGYAGEVAAKMRAAGIRVEVVSGVRSPLWSRDHNGFKKTMRVLRLTSLISKHYGPSCQERSDHFR